MSSVDNRIVQMQFDNKRFESNAKQSMSTLDKLKEKLNFSKESKELKEFQNEANSFSLGHMESTLDKIGDKFSLLGVIGMNAMNRIANAALNAGIALLKSISVDQISAGLNKYEQETNSVQAIYAAVKPRGQSLKDVYEVLEELSAYSDETSYSYTQMVDGMSKFIANGQDMKESAVVMQGIANAAAISGVSIQDAAYAFRNFSDAMSAGHFMIKDWMSIQNIHMDTEAFKNQVIQTAKELGKLDEQGRIIGEEKHGAVTAQNFREMLRYGFFDTDVIMKTMQKYADTTKELGLEAYHAAQQAKTFTDVIDAVKDAASTGWKTSFRLIFGNLEEAIDLFTPAANAIISVVNAIDEYRNSVLTGWRDLNGREGMISAVKNLWSVFEGFQKAFSRSWTRVFDVNNLMNYAHGMFDYRGNEKDSVYYQGFALADLTTKIEKATESWKKYWTNYDDGHGRLRLGYLQDIFTGVLSVVDIAMKAIGGFFDFVGEIGKQLTPTFDAVLNFFSMVGKDLLGLDRDINKNKTFSTLAKRLAKIFEPLTKRLPKAINNLTDFVKRVKEFIKTNPTIKTFTGRMKNLFNAIIDGAPKAIEGIFKFAEGILNTIKNSDEWKTIQKNFDKYIKPFGKDVVEFSGLLAQSIADFINMDTSDKDSLWEKLKKRFSAFDKLGPWIQEKWDNLKKNYPILQEIEDWWNTNDTVKEIKEWTSKIASAFDTFMGTDTSGETSIVGKIKMRFEAMWAELGPWLQSKWDEFKTNYPIFQQIEDFISGIFGKAGEADTGEAEEGAETAGGLIEKLQPLFDKIKEFVGKIDLGSVAIFGLAITMLVKAYKSVKELTAWTGLGQQISDFIEEAGKSLKDIRSSIKKKNMLANITAIMEVAASIWLLGDTLMKVSKLSWEEIGVGLAAMAGLFAEEGAFMFLMTKFNTGKGKLKPLQLVSVAVSMLILGNALKKVSSLDWEEIKRGLAAMGGLFAEQGAFMILVNRFGSTSLSVHKGASAAGMITLAASMYLLGASLKKVSSLDWDEINRGLYAMGGLFAEQGAFMILVNRFGSTSLSVHKGASAVGMIALAASMYLLGESLKKVSSLDWDEINRGLYAMGMLFVEQGAFMILVNRLGSTSLFSSKGLSAIGAIGVAGGIVILAGKLKELSEMQWDEINRGLYAMGGLFAEQGGFMIILGILSNKNIINPNAANIATGAVSAGIGMIADAATRLSKLSLAEIGKAVLAIAGIELLAGLLTGILGKLKIFETVKFSGAIGMAAIAGSIWILAQAFMPLSQIENWESYAKGVAAMASIMVLIGGFCAIMQSVKVKISSSLGTLVVAIAMAGLMVAFAFALSLAKDVQWEQIVAFGAGMALLGVAMMALSKAIDTLSDVPLLGALKGILVLTVTMVLLGLVASLTVFLAGDALASFADNMAIMGAQLAAFSEMIASVDNSGIQNAIETLKSIAEAFVEIGTKNYGKLDSFRTSFTRMGSSMVIFNSNIAGIDMEAMKAAATGIREMANSFVDFPDIADVSTSIANIGGAIKLYAQSVNGVTIPDEVPDASAIAGVFSSLKGAIPPDAEMAEVAEYAGKGDQLTNFATGLTNIGTAVQSFADGVKDLNFDNIQKATDTLTKISSLDSGLSTTQISHFGPFSTELTAQKAGLDTLATDIVSLGTALNSFGTSISAVNPDNLTQGTTVLGKIADLNNALPKEGGISSWIDGTQSLSRFAANLRLLGGGAKAFGESVSGVTFNSQAVSDAGDALIKIAEVNSKLPKTGGISSWFTGDENLGNLSKNLEGLGGGINSFAKAFGDTTITDQVPKALEQLSSLVDVQIKLSSEASWYSLNDFSSEMKEFAANMVEFNSSLTGIVWADMTQIKSLLNWAVNNQRSLGNTKYSKSLKDMGTGIKDFFKEIDSVNGFLDGGKLERISTAVSTAFDSVNKVFENTDTDNQQSLVTIVTTMLDDSTDAIDGKIEVFKTAGKNLVISISTGMKGAVSNVTSAARYVCNSASSAAGNCRSSFYAVGRNLSQGLADGISSNQPAPVNASVNVAHGLLGATRRTLGVRSPSKEFEEVGMYVDQGLANGLMRYANTVDGAATEVSKTALNSVLDELNAIMNLPLDSLEIQPTIRPVFDMSDVSSKAGMISSMFGGSRSIGFNTRNLEMQAQMLGADYSVNLDSINQNVRDMNERLDKLSEAITNMKIVLNSGALVGEMMPDIDRRMGTRAQLRERGN